MKRVVFVDDEPLVLDGLRRSLRPMRQEWDMHFCEGGLQALELLARDSFDVVVTDMRMPGMNGAQLLTEVKRQYPQVIRIVLSGHAEPDAVMQAFGVAQQYLLKPCDIQVLRRTVSRALALKTRLNDDNVKRIVGRMDSLPSLPSAYHELVTCLSSPDASLAEVGRIIAADPAMTTALLKVVNSAYFSLPAPISTVERAVSFLGLDTVMALTLQHDLFGSAQDMPTVSGFSPEALGRHSLATAAVARMLATQEESTRDLRDECFLAGMVHDIGKLVLAGAVPERYGEVEPLARTRGLSWSAAENEILKTNHSEVGAYLLGLWGFSDPLVEAVMFHTVPSQASTPGWGLAGLLHVASALATHPEVTDPDDPLLGLEPGYLAGLGLLDRWPEWQTASHAVLTRSDSS